MDAETSGFYHKSAPIIVNADTSPVGLGGRYLYKSKTISYASRSLSDIERRYPQMSNAVEFELLTDHKSLKCIYLLSTD